jgi:hypothetical protein
MTQTNLKVLTLYAGKLADLTGRTIEGARRFADDVAELRRGWFDRPPEATHEMLGELIGRVGGLMQAMAAPLLGHLDPAFLAMMEEVKAMLRVVFGTANALTIPISGTGSAFLRSTASP